MDDLCLKTTIALAVIEKLEGKLQDDTYLDKTITGISKEIEVLEEDATNEFFRKSGVKHFIKKNFNANHENLMSFAYRLSHVVLGSKIAQAWIPELYHELQNLTKWTLSIYLFELLTKLLELKSTILPSQELIELVWNKLIARLLLCQHDDQSYFWIKQAKNLISSFLTKVIQFDTKDETRERISKVTQDLLKAKDPILIDAVNSVVLSLTKKLEIRKLLELMTDHLTVLLDFKAKVHITKLKEEDVEETILNEFNDLPHKIWLKGLEVIKTEAFTENVLDRCLEISKKEYKLIPTMINLKNVKLNKYLWTVIIEYLSTFINWKPDLPPEREIVNPCDLKLFNSCLSSLNQLIPYSPKISESEFKVFIGLTMIPDMTPMTRSLVIRLINDVIEAELFDITLEDLVTQIWHLTRYTDWEIKDALLYLLSAEKLNLKSTSVPKILTDLAIKNLLHDSSFVRKAALKFLTKLFRTEEKLIPDINKKMENIFKNETEAIVRREAVHFCVIQGLNEKSEKRTNIILLATQDLDWEVREITLKFWFHQFESILDHHATFDDFAQEIKQNNILKGLHLLLEDYEKRIQSQVLKWAIIMKSRAWNKYLSKDKANSDLEQNKEALYTFLFKTDFEGLLKRNDEYCDYHYGLKSILDDIIQLDADESCLDTIDCI